MVYVYILKNQRGKYYIGITHLIPTKRLKKHNYGEVKSTSDKKPWIVIYSEEYSSYKTARIREKQIKSWHGGNAFKKLIATAAGSSNGRTAAFEAVYHGSNPCPAAVAMSNKFGGVK